MEKRSIRVNHFTIESKGSSLRGKIMNIDKHKDLSFKYPDCNQKWKYINEIDEHEIEVDIKSVMKDYIDKLDNVSLKHIYALLKEKELFVKSESKEISADISILSRGRVVMVNPGADGIGREQRHIHPYIVLGEFKETFIGVPITNMAYNNESKTYYLRNYYEVELKNPDTKKKYNEYRTRKPSVADIRNISGLDKRRIVDSELKEEKKFVPDTYLHDISLKIRESLAKI